MHIECDANKSLKFIESSSRVEGVMCVGSRALVSDVNVIKCSKIDNNGIPCVFMYTYMVCVECIIDTL